MKDHSTQNEQTSAASNSVKWTEDQRKVISLGHRNILVSAAAGSGKTAVLVERIIQMLTRDMEPLDVDELLVVTFTEAAAAEMKDRIRAAIEQKIEEDADNEHLRRQATLIHSARITTIHSFCLSVIREHFHVIDLDPGFRIGEEGELNLLKQDVIEAVLESYYEEAAPEFFRFVESYGGSKSDKNLETLILKIYEFSRSYPDAEEWLRNCVRAYHIETKEELQDSHFYECMERNVQNSLQGVYEKIKEGIALCAEEDGPYMYEAMLEDDQKWIDAIERASDYESYYHAFNRIKWKRMAPNKDITVSEEKASYVKKLREEIKRIITDLKEQYFTQEPEELLREMKICLPMMEQLVRIVLSFSAQFEETKRMRNMIDFDDMQQYALQILTEKKDDKFVPSVVAREYQEQFAEIMIDEYQDSNLIQETILTSVSRNSLGKPNLFMVGDVKQSIYRFRLSRPELFMEKYDTYSKDDGEYQRIDLKKNFRSREEVLDCVNFIFRKIMKRNLGGVEYDDDAALYKGTKYLDLSGNHAELILVEKEDREETRTSGLRRLTGREKEGLAIAARIKELMANHQVIDKEKKTARPIQYKDIVILTRSLKGYADVFARMLKLSGIPVYVGSREGYFDTQEIGVLLDYLRILNNRRQDIALASVLRSCFCGLTDEELARIKGEFKDCTFHEAVWKYAKEGSIETLKDKLSLFFSQLEFFRERATYLALHELLNEIMEQTGYLDYMRAFSEGEQREANLLMLLEKARVFEGTSYKGVFHFIRYIEQLKKYEIEYGEANVLGEEANTVRIMSIHKSKGLEFPVVIVAGLGKRFNRQDVSGNVVLHAAYGVGLECVRLDTRERSASFPKRVISKEEYLESTGEELRVLYVALTRAKEKLIMTGVLSNAVEKLELSNTSNRSSSEAFSFASLSKASTYLDWILPAVLTDEEKVPVGISLVHHEDIMKQNLEEAGASLLEREALERWHTEKVYDSEMQENLKKQYDYCYPYIDLDGKKLKFTVSELKKRAYLKEEEGENLYEEPDIVPLIPKFLQQEEGVSGASRGSAYHHVLERLDFSQRYDLTMYRQWLMQEKESGRITKEEVSSVKEREILRFLSTNTAKRMGDAALHGRLYKEQPFVLGIALHEAYPDIIEESCKENVLIQGIIDVFFEEEDGLVVLDYKTDRVTGAQELVNRYATQLRYYAKALEQITGKCVKEKIIYSFALQKEIFLS